MRTITFGGPGSEYVSRDCPAEWTDEFFKLLGKSIWDASLDEIKVVAYQDGQLPENRRKGDVQIDCDPINAGVLAAIDGYQAAGVTVWLICESRKSGLHGTRFESIQLGATQPRFNQSDLAILSRLVMDAANRDEAHSSHLSQIETEIVRAIAAQNAITQEPISI